MKALITIILSLSLSGNIYCENSSEILHELTQTFYSKSELILKYKKLGYKLIYIKKHNLKTQNNCFFIFEHIPEKDNFKTNRIFVLGKLDNNKYDLLFELNDFIYSQNQTDICDFVKNKNSFNKIVTKREFLTIELSYCGKKRELINEYFTFRWDGEYVLYKYSIIIQNKLAPDDDNHFVIDEYPVETLTDKDFGKITLKNFHAGILNPFKNKLPDYIYEIVR